jgi:hypothetical protein
LDLAVTYKEPEMRQREKDYISPAYVKRNSETEIPLRESPPTLTKEVIENVRPSGKAILTGGDNDELEPEVI